VENSKKGNGHTPDPPSNPVGIPITKNGDKPLLKSSSKTTLKLNDLLKGKPAVDQGTQVLEARSALNEPFTPEQLHLVWLDFAEQRKKFQAEYQLLIQPFEIRENNIIIQLLSTVQETMLNNFKSDLIVHLRDNLRNNSILVMGELREQEEKQMLYTPRDKFEYLVEKNPVLKKLRDRLGLDPDF
jgi:hypothetical protein